MKTPIIKHKLWGKLKKQAYDYYKIIPAKDSMFYSIVAADGEVRSRYTFEEAIEWIKRYREMEFKRLCYEALYERRKKKVKNL